MNTAQVHTISFLYKIALTKDVYTFYFKKPQGFTFLSGQYNRWTLPITAKDKKGSSRFFTISSSPLDPQTISVTTKIGDSDFKKALLKLQKDDEVKIFGPMGAFIFNENAQKPQIFLSGGIGITPFYSFLQYTAESNQNIPLFLFASVSTPEEMIYYDELKKIEAEHSSIHIIYVITKPESSQAAWSGETGRVTKALLKKYLADIREYTYYIVGPPPMIERTVRLLKNLHISDKQIKIEQFNGILK